MDERTLFTGKDNKIYSSYSIKYFLLDEGEEIFFTVEALSDFSEIGYKHGKRFNGAEIYGIQINSFLISNITELPSDGQYFVVNISYMGEVVFLLCQSKGIRYDNIIDHKVIAAEIISGNKGHFEALNFYKSREEREQDVIVMFSGENQ